MGGCRCSYKNCKSATKNSDNIHFFHYPVKNATRCRQWIENARKPEFYDLPEDQLRNKVVCELHFEERCFSNSTRKRLVHDAVPTLDIGCEEEPVFRSNGEYSHVFNDVQVLPANADCTIFTVDTEGMQQFCESDKVETYIYKNGVLVPVFKSEDSNISYYDTSNEDGCTMSDNIMQEHNSSSTSMQESNNSSLITNPQLSFNNFQQNNLLTFKTNNQTRRNLFQTQMPSYKKSKSASIINSDANAHKVICTEVEIDTKSGLSSSYGVSSVFPKNVEMVHQLEQHKKKVSAKSLRQKKILQKLNQHSRDLYSIKQLLKSNPFSSLREKQKRKLALQTLKRYIPNSLYDVLCYTVSKSNSAVLHDKGTFFKSLYLTSPQAYKLLLKNEWGLPLYLNDVESVEGRSKGIQTSFENFDKGNIALQNTDEYHEVSNFINNDNEQCIVIEVNEQSIEDSDDSHQLPQNEGESIEDKEMETNIES